MTENEKKESWLDMPDSQRFINNTAKFNDLMMMYRSAQVVIGTDNEMQQIKNKIGMFHDI